MAMAGADGSITISTELDTQPVEKSMNNMGRSIKYLLAGAIAAWMGLSLAAAKVGSAFDEAMLPIQARTQMTDEAIGRLGMGFRDMARQGTHSAKEIAKAFSKVAVYGMEAEESYMLMNYAMVLANATGSDLAKSAQFLSLALMKTGAGVEKSGRYIDAFSKVAALSGMSLANLQKAVIALAPTMNATGMSIEETSGALAQLYQGGLYGMKAARGMEQIFSALSGTASDAAAKAIEDLGISMFTATGEMRPFNDVMLETMDAIQGLATEQERATATAEIFRTVYGRAVFDELMQNRDAWQANIAAMYQAGNTFDGVGQAMGMAAAQSGTLTIALNRARFAFADMLKSFWGTKSDTKISFIDSIADRLWNLADKMREGGTLHNALAGFKNFGMTVFRAIGEAVTAVINVLRYLVGGMSFDELRASFAPLGDMFMALGEAAAGLAERIGDMFRALNAGTDSEAPGFFARLLDLLVRVAIYGVQFITMKMESLANAFRVLDGSMGGTYEDAVTLGRLFEALGSAISTAAQAVFDLTYVIGGALLSALSGFVAGTGEGITLGQLFHAMLNAVADAVRLAAAVIRAMAGVLGELLPWAIDMAIRLIGALMNAITTVTSDVYRSSGVFAGLARLLITVLTGAFKAFAYVVEFLLNNVRLLYPLLSVLVGGFIKLKIVKILAGLFGLLSKGVGVKMMAVKKLKKNMLLMAKGYGIATAAMLKKKAAMSAWAIAFGMAKMAISKYALLIGAFILAATKLTDAFDGMHPAMGAVAAGLGTALAAFGLFKKNAVGRKMIGALATFVSKLAGAGTTAKMTAAQVAAATAAQVKAGAASYAAGLKLHKAKMALAAAQNKTLAAQNAYLAAVTKSGAKSKAAAAASAKLAAAQKAEKLASQKAAGALFVQDAAKKKLIAANAKLAGSKIAVSGAMAATTVKAGFLTGAIGLLKKAFWAAAAAFKAIPFIGWAAAIVGATVAAVTFISKTREAADSTASFSARIAESKKQLDELAESVNRGTEAFEENRAAMDANDGKARHLKENILELAKAQERTAGETTRLAMHIDELNRLVPGLGLAFDATAGMLNKTAEAMDLFVGAGRKMERINAYTERRNELDSRNIEISGQLNNARAALLELEERIEPVNRGNAEAQARINRQVEAARQLYDELTQKYTENRAAAAGLAMTIDGLMEAYGLAREEAARLLKTLARQAMAINEIYAIWKEYDRGLSEVFRNAANNSEASAEAVIASVREITDEAQQSGQAWTDFNRYMQKAEQIARDLGLGDYAVEHIRAMGVDGLPLLQEFVNGCNSLLSELDQALSEHMAAVAAATAARVEAMGDVGSEMISAAVSGMRNNPELENEAVRQVINAAEGAGVEAGTRFALVGQHMGGGIVAGLGDTHGYIEKACGRISRVAIDYLRTALGIRSPSRKTREMGVSLGEGLAAGMGSMADGVAGVTRKLVDKILSTVQRLDLTDVGRGIAQGLISGIDSMISSAAQTARRLSQAVESAVTGYMQIRSPSRLFLSHGRSIVEGLKDGITGYARTAVQAAARMSEEIYGQASSWVVKYKMSSLELASHSAELWKEHLEEFRRMEEAKTDEQRQAASERARVQQQETALFLDWLDKRVEYLELTAARELFFMAGLLEGMEANTAERIALEERYRARQQAMLEYAQAEHARIIAEMEVLENDFLRAVGNRTEELLRTFDMFSELELSVTDIDRNAQEVDRLTAAYERASEALRGIREDLSDVEFGTNQHIRLLEREQEAMAAREEAQRSLKDAVAADSRSQASILADNLQGQIDNLSEWARQLDLLTRRGVDEGFIEHMRRMGPTATRYLQLLNDSTDDELTRLSELYREKHQAARRYAERELQGLREDTMRQIASLQNDLIQIGVEQYPAVGRELMRGIERGIEQGRSAVINAAAIAVVDAIAEAKRRAGIKSPSKEGVYIGQMFSEGIAIGIDKGAAAIKKAVCDIAAYMKDFGGHGLLRGLDNVLPNIEKMLSVNIGLTKTKHTETEARPLRERPGGFTVNINQPVKSPYETARAIKNTLVDMGVGHY